MTQLLHKNYLLLFFVLITASLFSQEGIVSGTLKSQTDGLPLPGVSIIIKGTKTGVQTDFDGYYQIPCRVGQTLVYSFVGMKAREVRVTPQLFDSQSHDNMVEEVPVKPIENEAYKKAIQKKHDNTLYIPNLEQSNLTYNKDNYFQYERIKHIDIKKDKVDITYFDPDIFFEVGYNTIFGIQYFKDKNLPQLQNTYAQGGTLNGNLTFQGAETGNLFSYGPKISNLEFDGSNYAYDNNGQLVSVGEGNGNPAVNYDNSVLKTAIKTSNNLFFNVSTQKSKIELNYTNTTLKDVFNSEKSSGNDLKLSFKNRRSYHQKGLNWLGYVSFGNYKNNQPNVNGFLNNALLNSWATPSTFSNAQGNLLSNSSQRSFNSNFNNPNWLLAHHQNTDKTNYFIATIQNDINISEDINVETNLSYTYNKNSQNFGLPTNTVGFEDGYLSSKAIKTNVFNALLKFTFDNNNYSPRIKGVSQFDFSSEHMQYDFNEANGFMPFSFENPESNNTVKTQLNRTSLRLLNSWTFNFSEESIDIIAANNAYISSLQDNKLFLPYLEFKVDVADLIYIDFLDQFYVTATTSYDVNEPHLFYNNMSHNSLLLTPEQSLSYTANNDLFLTENLQLEEKKHYEFDASMRFYLLNSGFNFKATYFNSETQGSVFPVLENNAFKLQNTADISNKGFEMSLNTRFYLIDKLYYKPSIVFSKSRTRVQKLYNDAQNIPIAGFSTVSKNLIVGERAGVIVGSAYTRDAQNNIVIDDQGFPLVNAQSKIIGDPTPDFNLGFENNFEFKNFNLNLVLDFQKGGDVWNGTQNTLNYLGTSQQSANDRNITNFIFQGVNQNGNPNTIPVDFYNPENDISQNRFVRYGFSGVDEDAIEDGSYINLKSVSLSYTFKQKNKNTFFRQIDMSLYANNLITWTAYEGASPYRNLYDSPSGQALNFFNMPITSEVGFKLNVKI
ncbi:carboxypeptidase-like regulatory domain-containing protein [Psychroserpens damuponensis]|uniref:carboxypeptidase-like regulatory domain-containing protein n=1 Tax=Psychroserpens damuponensis TaxID=943936 RepID=UPI00058E1EAB|nr:carboxypeptidase-like regulatory domain-containing protein [Psychroserpens damuponensis]